MGINHIYNIYPNIVAGRAIPPTPWLNFLHFAAPRLPLTPRFSLPR